MQVPYSGELFTISTFLVFCNRVCNSAFAISMTQIKGETLWNQAPLWKYLIISLSNVAATTCQYEALKYVSFPVQMLGKSFKMMPVMMWGMLISGKRYSLSDWVVAALITEGVTQFLMTGQISAPNEAGNSFWGLFLLLLFLACDGLTSTFQEKLFKEHKTSKYNQMFYVNVCSATTSFLALLFAGQFSQAIAFCVKHPGLLKDTAVLSISATASQFFIYSQVKEFGALVFAATMNVRQVASIVVSYIQYGHSITRLQVLALFIVFSALFYKSYAGLASSPGQGSKSEKKPLVNKEGSGSDAKASSPVFPGPSVPETDKAIV